MSVQDNYLRIQQGIAEAAAKAGRNPAEVRLVAAAKRQPAEKVAEAIACGVEAIGENRVQEAQAHQAALGGEKVAWHLIGHLQRNKVHQALGLFSMLHSLDSLRLAEKIESEARQKEISIQALVQVNVAGEASKGGFEVAELEAGLACLKGMEMIEVRGLMTMPPFFADPEEARPFFRQLAELKELANRDGWYRVPIEQLSMGMSGDYMVAVEEGATMIRLGTILFGERN